MLEVDVKGMLYEGRFHYAGGHPLHPVQSSAKTVVRVSSDGIQFLRRGFVGKLKESFAIPVGEINRCVTRKSGIDYMNLAEHYVDVTIEHGGQEFVVAFKALGMRKERDASRLYVSVMALIAPRDIVVTC